MPQLDRIIVLPQIFWFFVVFILFYSIILHYILPQFLLILKSRKKVLIYNMKLLRKLESNTKGRTLVKVINKYLLISTTLQELSLEQLDLTMIKVDEKIAKRLKNINLYINLYLLSLISFKTKNLTT